MPREPRKFLDDMLQRAQRVTRLVDARQRDEVVADEVVWLALERDMSIIGEALMQLHRMAPETAERVDRWRDIIGFRHVLIHGYDDLDIEVFWSVIQTDLPKLIVQVESLLTELN